MSRNSAAVRAVAQEQMARVEADFDAVFAITRRIHDQMHADGLTRNKDSRDRAVDRIPKLTAEGMQLGDMTRERG